MNFLRHSSLLWLYGAIGVSAALFLPLLITDPVFLASAAFGACFITVSILCHMTWLRRAQLRRQESESQSLRAALDHLQNDVNGLAQEVHRRRDGAQPLDSDSDEFTDGEPEGRFDPTDRADETARVDRVVAEIEILQSLIHRLYDDRGQDIAPTATADNDGFDSATDQGADERAGGPNITPRNDEAATALERFEALKRATLDDIEVYDGLEEPVDTLSQNDLPRDIEVPEPDVARPMASVDALDDSEEPADQEQQTAPAPALSLAPTPAPGPAEPPRPVEEGRLAPPIPYEPSEDEILALARDALRDDRIDLVLQPVVKLPQRKRRFYEAFSRLRTDDGYAVMPEQYIKLAEREGLVTTIDNMLLFRCVQLVRKIQRRGEVLDFFCNISSRSWEDDSFFNDFIEFLRANLRLAENLIFEFSQLDFERWGEDAEPRMSQLAKLGCRFSLDQVRHLNFNPSSLARREIRFLKIGPEIFFQQARGQSNIVRDFEAAGITLIIDKVEDEATLRELLDHNVVYAQGYLFSEPRLAKPAA